ncbi:hypothetical protein AA313_de0202811 [Arthrobotrys entomopaga]|nr:hypothetical protein AA313_de0202811 [Arthrobotrys entomopaga]
MASPKSTKSLSKSPSRSPPAVIGAGGVAPESVIEAEAYNTSDSDSAYADSDLLVNSPVLA